MKRQGDIEELIEHFTLVEDDQEFLANKTGPTRLGCALLLKCFQYEGHFPPAKHDIPRSVVDYVAHQLKLDPALYAQYDWEGRTVKGHRTQIREHLGFREATNLDTEEMTSWLVTHILAADQNLEHLKVVVTKRFRERKIEPPTTDRVERLIRSGCHTYEQQLFAEIMQRLQPSTCTLLDDLLAHSVAVAEQEEQVQDDEPEPTAAEARRTPITWQNLKTSPGRAAGSASRRSLPNRSRMICASSKPRSANAGASPHCWIFSRRRSSASASPSPSKALLYVRCLSGRSCKNACCYVSMGWGPIRASSASVRVSMGKATTS